jgi:hypothetical protein
MTLIVEDGSIVSGAESYISAADADTYFANRNNSVWSALSTQVVKESYLRLATDYMLQAYHLSWDGYRYNVNQPLDWPRVWVTIWDVASGYGPYPNYIAPTVVPKLVQYACAELAIRASSAQLAPDISEREKVVKVGSIQVEYDMNAPVFTTYRAVDMMLKQFFKNGGSSSMAKVYRS